MGVPDVDWLAERVSADMLDQWRRFEESFGPLTIQERLDVVLAGVLARGSGKAIREFLPQWGGGRSDADDIAARLTAMAQRGRTL